MKGINTKAVRALFALVAQYPTAGDRELSRKIVDVGEKMGRTAIASYRHRANEQDLSPAKLALMDDEQLINIFGTPKKEEEIFVEPDWGAIREFLDKPLSWSNQLPTIAQAYNLQYMAVYWPNYLNGQRPPQCMSQRTFERRFAAYLDQKGLSAQKHHANMSLNFGPASMMEIDTIGDRLTFIDAQGNSHETVVFTAVLKYSGMIYAEAMNSGNGYCWGSAIINACKYFGGCCQSLRADNDTAICVHGKSAGRRGGSRLRPMIAYLLKELDMVVDLCPIKAPRWKGLNERSNFSLERHLFETHPQRKNLHAADLAELNQMIQQDLLRINSLPRDNNQLSRMAVFNDYEKPKLKPLPLILPVVRHLSICNVRQDGYVRFQNNFYYVGMALAGKMLVVENCENKLVRLLTDFDYKEQAVYDLDTNQLPPGNRHKLQRFCTEKERILTRDKEWFLSDCEQWPAPHEWVVNAVEMVWSRLCHTPAVAARLCNSIWSLYAAKPDTLPAINEACHLAVTGNHMSAFRRYLHDAYEIMCRQDFKTPEEPKAAEEQPATASKQPSQDMIRGGAYYDSLCH